MIKTDFRYVYYLGSVAANKAIQDIMYAKGLEDDQVINVWTIPDGQSGQRVWVAYRTKVQSVRGKAHSDRTAYYLSVPDHPLITQDMLRFNYDAKTSRFNLEPCVSDFHHIKFVPQAGQLVATFSRERCQEYVLSLESTARAELNSLLQRGFTLFYGEDVNMAIEESEWDI